MKLAENVGDLSVVKRWIIHRQIFGNKYFRNLSSSFSNAYFDEKIEKIRAA